MIVHIKHGHSKKGQQSSEYMTWAAMLQRCKNPKHTFFKNYGGRGIGVCKRWLWFENFLKDMGKRPSGKTLDRIDNDGDYEPNNCRWATRKEQSANSRKPEGSLSVKDVESIRRRRSRGEKLKSIAESFGVTESHISRICSSKDSQRRC